MIRFLPGLAVALLLAACNSPKPLVVDNSMMIENRQLDTVYITPEPEPPAGPEVVSYELPDYNPSATRENDLLHTVLRLRFDWEQEQVLGMAELRLKPYFYPVSNVTLDAKDFQFNRIALQGEKDTLRYRYDGEQVHITLPRAYSRDEEYVLSIDYVATPAESGGSAAITSDKGLYFINPRGEEGDKPRQIWTQGETESNSRWFPTIDKPNERTTQEMYVTVDDEFETLSNGVLAESTTNADGTRTDYWVMEQPHAPYLFMLTVGDFAIVEDEPWNGIPVNYYVEKEYAADAEAIFPYTPEMLTFFSDLVDLPYPWPKYSQVVVRDYVSGAMENTTAVIFGEFMQGHERDLIDVDYNEKIVAHEMFHHWFGDLVTTESWANLTLQEGFANYSEYLWMEYKHGRDAADYHLLTEWSGYFGSANRGGIHPLIWYGYADKEDMFDAHSYNKGGSVLHMLRYELGDEAFFAGLNKYLTDNAFTAVEVDELRMAFEDVSGRDLNWFFNQWYLSAGHPKLDISYGYDPATGEALVTVAQTQEPTDEQPAIFQLPTTVDVYDAAGQVTRHSVTMTEREQTFRLPASAEPALIVFDAEHVLLAQRNEERSTAQLVFQYTHAPRFYDRYAAVARLAEQEPSGEGNAVITAALADPFYAIRELALDAVPETPTPEMLTAIRTLAQSDPHSSVRATAIEVLAEFADEQAGSIARAALDARPYPVVSAGLEVLAQLDPAAAAAAATQLEDADNPQIIATLASLYAEAGNTDKLPFFATNLRNVDGPPAVAFYEAYQTLLADAGWEQADAGVAQLQAVATDMGQSPWRRLAATKSVSDLGRVYESRIDDEAYAAEKDMLSKKVLEVGAVLTAIKAAETNEQLQQLYQQF
jgi:aminopeptidase N